MAGDWHESIVNLIQERPAFAFELLKLADDEDYGEDVIDGAERSTNAVGSKSTTERRADAVTKLHLLHREFANLVLICEVQSTWSDDKYRRLLGYVARAFEDHPESDVDLLIVCRTDALAKRYQHGVRINRRFRFVPLTLGPRDLRPFTDPGQPGASADAAVLRLLFHPEPDEPDLVINTVDELLGTIGEGQAADYVHMLLDLTGEQCRQLLEELMQTARRTYHSEFTERFRREGLEQGLEQGHLESARAFLLEIFEMRGLALDEALRERIASCQDLDRLNEWRQRAKIAANAAEVFAE
jgi:hypothetical protein